MNIAFILPSLKDTAPVAVIELLSRLMVQHGHTCHVFYFDDKTELNFACSTQRINIKKSIDFTAFDIVHSTGMRPDIYVAKFREYSGCTKYITTIHNFFMEDFTSQYNKLVAHICGRRWMRAVNKLDTVVVLSKVGMEYYNRWIKKSHLTYAYNAREISLHKTLDLNEERKVLDFKSDAILIGVNAMLSPIKGVDQLIKALVKLPNHKLFIVGDGKDRKTLEKLSVSLGVADRVYFAGFIKDAYRFLKYYDIYGLSSRSEGFPLCLLEAAQYQVPTVCSRIPIFLELFDANQVMFFDVDNIDSLVTAIIKATNNCKMGQLMHNYSMKHYTPLRMYERYLAIYHGEV